jgi:hypothetical protein
MTQHYFYTLDPQCRRGSSSTGLLDSVPLRLRVRLAPPSNDKSLLGHQGGQKPAQPVRGYSAQGMLSNKYESFLNWFFYVETSLIKITSFSKLKYGLQLYSNENISNGELISLLHK